MMQDFFFWIHPNDKGKPARGGGPAEGQGNYFQNKQFRSDFRELGGK
jgi:hypothetical protein